VARHRVVILGGGFGGLACARALEARRDRDLEVVLVNRDNYFVFQPLLPEAISGSIQPAHCVAPLRGLLRRTEVRACDVERIDVGARTVHLVEGDGQRSGVLPYDDLVLALGTVVQFGAVPGMDAHALPMKTLGDALHLRSRILHRLEEAEHETNAERRASLLTFVVVGGGFSGVEVIAELRDFVRRALRFYRRIGRAEVRFVLLHSGARILPELSEMLGAFAHRRLQKRGVEVRLQCRVKAVTENAVILPDGERLATRTLVSTVGNAPHPLLGALGLACERGRVKVEPTLEVPDRRGLWTIGDCAAVPDRILGGLCPATAQHAWRQGKWAARNLLAVRRGGAPRPFRYRMKGQLASLGHHSAVAQVFGIRVAGILAWWLWRTLYLFKHPSWERRARIALDWSIDVFSPAEIVAFDLERTKRVAHLHFEPGEVVFRQGDRGERFFVVVAGCAEAVRAEEGRETVLGRIGPGEHFGEGSLLRGTSRSATIRALTPLDCIAMRRGDFVELADKVPALRAAIDDSLQRHEAQAKREARPASGAAGRVEDMMAKEVQSLREAATLREAVEIFRASRHGGFPVLDERGDVVGVFTQTDLRRLVDQGTSLDTPVGRLATRRLVTVLPSDTLDVALDLLARNGVGRLLVVDPVKPRRLVGILTRSDLVAGMCAAAPVPTPP